METKRTNLHLPATKAASNSGKCVKGELCGYTIYGWLIVLVVARYGFTLALISLLEDRIEIIPD